MGPLPFEIPPSPDDVNVVWIVGLWRFELWGTTDTGWIVIYNGPQVALRRPAQGMEDVRETAEAWLSRVGGGETAEFRLPEPSRRHVDHRRTADRGGRRTADHDPPEPDPT
jgi:hypothetical protein